MNAQRRLVEHQETPHIEQPAKAPAARKPPVAMPREDARMLLARAEAFAAGHSLDHATGEEKWSSRRTITFAAAASAGLWACVFMVSWFLTRVF